MSIHDSILQHIQVMIWMSTMMVKKVKIFALNFIRKHHIQTIQWQLSICQWNYRLGLYTVPGEMVDTIK
ncbi:hypothetical protein ZOSMA_184G00110 [Zostera marina]|uniref:Uncharacterized protein n=1 Tax=Zostera marina TaxID=29655 RepID=A0A0K9PSQ6_ZOSMR|nr:hypothetical protein ZOSMA_184G00110 [Zostera marina]